VQIKLIGAKAALPMHPRCFEMFKKMSMERFGKVDIDGLWQLREVHATIHHNCHAFAHEEQHQGCRTNRFRHFPRTADLEIVSGLWWVSDQECESITLEADLHPRYYCEPGTEYLVAVPIRVPGLDDLVRSCLRSEDVSDVVFASPARATRQPSDAFEMLPAELCSIVLELVTPRDVAALRLVSPAFTQLPQMYFNHLVRSEMPWMWEINELSLPLRQMDWYRLWCALAKADGGPRSDERERAYIIRCWEATHKRAMAAAESEGWDRNNPGLNREASHWEGRIRWWDSLYTPFHKAADEEAEVQIGTDFSFRGLSRPMGTELRGLRNRRRIYADIEEILRRIEESRPPVDRGPWPLQSHRHA